MVGCLLLVRPGIAPRKRDQLFGGCGIHATTSDDPVIIGQFVFFEKRVAGGEKKTVTKKSVCVVYLLDLLKLVYFLS